MTQALVTGVNQLVGGVTYALPAPACQLLSDVAITGLTGSNVEPGVKTTGGFITPAVNTVVVVKKHTLSGNSKGMSAYETAVRASNPSNYWRLNETAGLVAQDKIAGTNGTIVGGVTLNGGTNGMTFNGTTGKITTPTPIVMTTTLAVEAWVKTASTGSDRAFWTNRQASALPATAVMLGVDLNGKFYVHANGLGRGVSVTSINNNTWRHVVWVQNGSTAELYIDGVLDYTAGAPFSANTLTVTIGSDPEVPTFWLGSIKEVAIYPRALSLAEIQAHYNARP